MTNETKPETVIDIAYIGNKAVPRLPWAASQPGTGTRRVFMADRKGQPFFDMGEWTTMFDNTRVQSRPPQHLMRQARFKICHVAAGSPDVAVEHAIDREVLTYAEFMQWYNHACAMLCRELASAGVRDGLMFHAKKIFWVDGCPTIPGGVSARLLDFQKSLDQFAQDGDPGSALEVVEDCLDVFMLKDDPALVNLVRLVHFHEKLMLRERYFVWLLPAGDNQARVWKVECPKRLRVKTGSVLAFDKHGHCVAGPRDLLGLDLADKI